MDKTQRQSIDRLKRLQKELLEEYSNLVVPFGLSDIPPSVSKEATKKIKSWFEIQNLIKSKGEKDTDIIKKSNARFL